MIHGSNYEEPNELITADEVAQIMVEAGDAGDMRRASEITRAYLKYDKLHSAQTLAWFTYLLDHVTDFYIMLAFVYQGGRIQGIREQRQLQRQKGGRAK